MRISLLALLVSSILLPWATAAEVDFAHEIVPILKQQCGKCHTGTQKKGGFSLNSRESLLTGGESGAVVVSGKGKEGDLVQRITSRDAAIRMPPEGEPLSEKQVKLLQKWIDAGLPWDAGFTLGTRAYEPPLTLKPVELPAAVAGRNHPLDRLLDAYSQKNQLPTANPLSDAAFARRAYLDLIGLLPTPEELDQFVRDPASDKRTQLIRNLLDRDGDYAEHWLTFWNDLLRNDYAGTGFITGGRKQISKWLYSALVTNKPYDQMVRELIAPPTAESAGFADGIRWRGEVSAGQTVEIQFAQSVGQAFLGINLKCASCHDSFIDRWTLEDAYGLAAVYAAKPLELHRCDLPTGRTAKAAWLFPTQGKIDPNAPPAERLKQLAALLTSSENARFARTIVNRYWQRLMGRGIVHPLDAMQMEPWHAELLDYLAQRLIDSKYDLKQLLELIATSAAYQSQAEVVVANAEDATYRYRGPRAKRLTAEQFVDSVWQLTGTAPTKFDAPVVRGKRPKTPMAEQKPLTGTWIWTQADAGKIPGGETRSFLGEWEITGNFTQAAAVVACDNSYTLYVNDKKLQTGENWEQPDLVALTAAVKPGKNQIVIVAKNGGGGPNPAGLFFEARAYRADGTFASFATSDAWKWSKTVPAANGKFRERPTDWAPAAKTNQVSTWMPRVEGELQSLLEVGNGASKSMVRAALVKSNFLMRTLGRPNRDQIVSVRPDELSTLEAIDLSNGETLAAALRTGGQNIIKQKFGSVDDFTRWLYRYALSRDPNASELQTIRESMPQGLSAEGIEDALWSVVMLPEFMLVR